MERNTEIGEFRLAGAPGFTLIELLIVVSIIGILATLAAPSYQTSVVKAKEAALRQDLFTLRDVLDQHRADQGKYPASLRSACERWLSAGDSQGPLHGLHHLVAGNDRCDGRRNL